LSLTRQAELLGISRSSLYYHSRSINPFALDVMNRIDKINTRWPSWGSRKITAKLNINFKKESLGLKVNRKRIKRLMRIMDIEAIYPRKYTSMPDKQHEVYPYLLRGLTINKPQIRFGVLILPISD